MSLPPSHCRSNKAPTLLPPLLDAGGNRTCMPGFFCPHLDPRNATTWPQYCPPTVECALRRNFGSLCEEPQGRYEPMLCLPGSYCSHPGLQLKCPVGHWCNHGTVTPHKCTPLSLCPEGTNKPRDLAGVLALVVCVAAVLGLRALYLRKLRYRATAPSPCCEPADSGLGGSAIEKAQAALGPFTELVQRVRGARPPVRIDFTDLRVTIPPGEADGEERVLLQGVSGALKPGKVTAIMGPSGAGKTIFLHALLRKLDPAWRTDGTLEVNRDANVEMLRNVTAFVPQDDSLHTELTVDANLYYSAEMRLPREWSGEDRARMRDVVLKVLQLDEHRHTIIGTAQERGVSGGQRKRASIGVELVTGPQLLLLDEPTSGLDSTTALELLRLLKETARAANITIAMIVQQPRVEIFEALDELLILGVGGTTVYRGPQAAIVPHFESAGVVFDPRKNPADVIMDTIAAHPEQLNDAWRARENDADDDMHAHVTPMAAFDKLNTTDAAFRGATPLRQVALFHLRSLEKQLTNMTTLVIEVVIILVCGLVLANAMSDFDLLAAFKVPYQTISPMPRYGWLPELSMYFLIVLSLAGAVAGVNVLGNERPQYFREVPSGISRVSYFVGSVTAAVYRVLLASLAFAAMFELVAGVVVPFGTLYGVAAIAYWCVYGIGVCVSVVVPQQSAALVASTISILLSIFNGWLPFPLFMKRLNFGFYLSQIFQDEFAKPIDHFTVDAIASQAGYQRDQKELSYVVMVIFGVAFHALALALMVGTHRAQQR